MGQQTTNTTDDEPEREYRKISLFGDVDPRYPLCYVPISMHLGIDEFREQDAAENLRRAKAVFKTYRELGVTLWADPSDRRPWTEEDITEELITTHLGQRPNMGMYTAASFDDHLLDIIASHTGVPRVSYIHIRKDTPQLRWPCDIYQEVGDKEGEERRRVEVYADGRHLWVKDNIAGTGETYKDDTRFPGLDNLNKRLGQSARMIAEDDFERLWRRATSEDCRWPESVENDEVVHCGRHRDHNRPWCVTHEEFARLMFPRLFGTE